MITARYDELDEHEGEDHEVPSPGGPCRCAERGKCVCRPVRSRSRPDCTVCHSSPAPRAGCFAIKHNGGQGEDTEETDEES